MGLLMGKSKILVRAFRNNAYSFACDETGTTAIEYGLIGGIVGVGLVSSLGNLLSGVDSLFIQIVSWL